jgi:hypothetical protein
MKKVLLLLFFLNTVAYAQQEDAWVYFTDKPDTAYYMANPLEMLSQKALNRRTAQGIALDAKDVPLHQAYINGVAATTGITVMAKSKWLNALHIRGTEATIAALENLAYVDHVAFASHSLNNGRIMQPAQTTTTQTTLENYNYGGSAGQVQMLNGHLLHQQGYTGEGITIAVMYAGFPGVNSVQPFQHLQNNGLVLGGHNFVANSTDFYTGGTHGTKVLSILAGYTEGQLVGSAPDASYYLFVTEDALSENPVEESYWVEAAEMADSLGVDLINTSLGYFQYDDPDYNYTYADMDGETAFISRGAAIAFSRGMLLVTSAGNDGADAEPHISVPADAINTLTVGAVDENEQYAYFSSIGPSADGRIKPDVMAKGLGDTYANPDGTISTGNGTSFSAPVMAGVVACLWQAAPGKTNAEIVQIVKESADRYNNPNAQYGYGIPDFSNALEAALGLQEVAQDRFVLYPNPTSGIIYFPSTVTDIRFYNALGQEVYKAHAVNTVNIEKLPAGFYSYIIMSGNTTQSGKLIKQ